MRAIGTTPSPARRIAALAVALLTGALGWLATAWSYMLIPVFLLPALGNSVWTISVLVFLLLASLGWSAAAGVLLFERTLGAPSAIPYRRQGRRGWLSMGVCCVGLAVGICASFVTTGAVAEEWFRVSFKEMVAGKVGGWLLSIAFSSTVGAGPVLGLLSARALCRRWILGSRRSGGQPPVGSVTAAPVSPPPTQDPETPLLPAVA